MADQWWRVDVGKSGARVWRGDGVHRKEGSSSAIAAEADRLSWLAAQGLPCPRNVDPERAGWTGQQLLAELHRTRPPDEDLVVGHGDPCLPNMFFDDDGRLTALIDVDRLGTADRYNDLAIATRSLAHNWHPRYAEQLLREYGVAEPDRSRIAFYRLLDEFF
jgi:aminoglycoside phosphotransferase